MTSFRCLPFTWHSGSANRQIRRISTTCRVSSAQCSLPSTTHCSALDRSRVSSLPMYPCHFWILHRRASIWQESLEHLNTLASDTKLSMLRMHFLTNANTFRWLIVIGLAQATWAIAFHTEMILTLSSVHRTGKRNPST